jgi:hypothetical protein
MRKAEGNMAEKRRRFPGRASTLSMLCHRKSASSLSMGLLMKGPKPFHPFLGFVGSRAFQFPLPRLFPRRLTFFSPGGIIIFDK